MTVEKEFEWKEVFYAAIIFVPIFCIFPSWVALLSIGLNLFDAIKSEINFQKSTNNQYY